MHGYETKELQQAALDGLVREKEAAEARLAHAQTELETGIVGPQKAYLERVVENAGARMHAVEQELRQFAASARPRRRAASKR